MKSLSPTIAVFEISPSWTVGGASGPSAQYSKPPPDSLLEEEIAALGLAIGRDEAN
jgi:hypothetical protein